MNMNYSKLNARGIVSIENGKTNVRCKSRGFGLAVKSIKIANA